MKKQFIPFAGKIIFSSFLYLSLVALPLSSVANGNERTTKKIGVEYKGRSEGLLMFQVAYDNISRKNFLLELVDGETNEVVYKNVYNDSSFVKTFFVDAEKSTCNLIFRIRCGKERAETAFNISNKVRFVEEILVTPAR